MSEISAEQILQIKAIVDRDVKYEYFFDLLQRIKQRPGMYLGKPSITRLRSFLNGSEIARAELGLPDTEQQQQLDGFQEWI